MTSVTIITRPNTASSTPIPGFTMRTSEHRKRQQNSPLKSAATTNQPFDVTKKNSEVARKLQLYGISTALRAGKCPSNDQIDIAVNSILSQRIIRKPPSCVSRDGRILIKDACTLVRSAQMLLLSKNEGNILQDTYWNLRGIHLSDLRIPERPVSRSVSGSDRVQALRALHTVANVIVTNGQFRKLLKDVGILFRDIASDAATSASKALRPSEEQLAQLNLPAEDHVWYSEPNFDGIRTRAKLIVSPDKYHNRSSSETSSASSISGPRRISRHRTFRLALNRSEEFISPRSRDKIRVKREAFLADAQAYLEQKVPKERQQSIAFRVKKMVQECQHKADFRSATISLLRLLKRYKDFALELAEDGQDSIRETRYGPSTVRTVELNLKTLIERFANGTSLDGLLSAVKQISLATKHDAHLRHWLQDLNGFLKRCMLDGGYLLEDYFSEDWHDLHSVGHALLRDKYKTQTDKLAEEIRFIVQQFEEDDQNKNFIAAFKKVLKDIGQDSEGRIKFKPHLFKDLIEVFLPAALAKVSYIPLPRIEFTSDEYDVIIENLVLQSANFTPNAVHWNSETNVNWTRTPAPTLPKAHKRNVSSFSGRSFKSTRSVKSTHITQSCELYMSGIQFDLRGVAFHVKRKSGFPKVSDTGIADLLLPSDGLAVRIGICFTKDPAAAAAVAAAPATGRPNSSGSNQSKSTAEPSTAKLFHLTHIDIDVSRLKVNIVESRHKILHSIFKSHVAKALRKVLTETTERILREKAAELDELLWGVHSEAVAHVERCKEINRRPLGRGRRYYRAAKLMWRTRAQRKATLSASLGGVKKKAGITKFTWSATNSLLPNVILPVQKDDHGRPLTVTGRASEFKELSKQGSRWQSPVFSLGGAKGSKAQEVKRVNVVRKPVVFGAKPRMTGHLTVPTAEGNEGDNDKPDSCRTGTTLVGEEEEDDKSDSESFYSCDDEYF